MQQRDAHKESRTPEKQPLLRVWEAKGNGNERIKDAGSLELELVPQSIKQTEPKNGQTQSQNRS